ncbi:MAG: hypothetical protein K1X28_00225 [Parachlamydiales bacterium]|nr:hypothetical protein [Parachlamydiales bacterium]
MLKNSAFTAGAVLSLLIGPAFAECNPCMPGQCCVNPSARCNENTGFDITGSLLWWKASQPDIPYAFVNASEVYQDVGFLDYINFSWNPGFRVEACWETDYDAWNLSANYTWMHNEARGHCGKVTNPEIGFTLLNDIQGVHYPYPLFEINDTTHVTDTFNLGAGSASAKWEMRYNMFNLQLTKAYLVSQKLALSPFIGAQGGWINRKLETILSLEPFHPTQQDTIAVTNFWGVGPRFGLNSDWKVGCGFEFFGNLATALLYGASYDDHISALSTDTGVFIDSSPYFTDIVRKHDKSRLVPAIQMMAGLGWNDCFNWSCHDYYVDLRASWEVNLYLNMQNFLNQQAVQAAYVFPTSLQLGGLTASATFGF